MTKVHQISNSETKIADSLKNSLVLVLSVKLQQKLLLDLIDETMQNKVIACYLSFRHNLCGGRKDWPFLLGACAGDGKENERCDREGSCVRSRGWEMSEKNMGDTYKQNLGEDFLFPVSRGQRDSMQSAPNQEANATCWTMGKTGRRDLPCRLWVGGCVWFPCYMNLFLSFLTQHNSGVFLSLKTWLLM